MMSLVEQSAARILETRKGKLDQKAQERTKEKTEAEPDLLWIALRLRRREEVKSVNGLQSEEILAGTEKT